MIRIISIVSILCLLGSCGNSKNFNSQKYTNFNKIKIGKSKAVEQLRKNDPFNVQEDNTSELIDVFEDRSNYNSIDNDQITNEIEETEIIIEDSIQVSQDNIEEPSVIHLEEELNKQFHPVVLNKSTLPPPPADEDKNGSETNTMALLAFICLCTFSLMPIGIILGIIAKVQIKRNPGKYKNEWMANWAIWGPLIILVLFMALIFVAYSFY